MGDKQGEDHKGGVHGCTPNGGWTHKLNACAVWLGNGCWQVHQPQSCLYAHKVHQTCWQRNGWGPSSPNSTSWIWPPQLVSSTVRHPEPLGHSQPLPPMPPTFPAITQPLNSQLCHTSYLEQCLPPPPSFLTITSTTTTTFQPTLTPWASPHHPNGLPPAGDWPHKTHWWASSSDTLLWPPIFAFSFHHQSSAMHHADVTFCATTTNYTLYPLHYQSGTTL